MYTKHIFTHGATALVQRGSWRVSLTKNFSAHSNFLKSKNRHYSLAPPHGYDIVIVHGGNSFDFKEKRKFVLISKVVEICLPSTVCHFAQIKIFGLIVHVVPVATPSVPLLLCVCFITRPCQNEALQLQRGMPI